MPPDVYDTTESDMVDNDGLNFPVNPPLDMKPKPIVIDPNQTYQFGNITSSGQDLVRSLVAPQNPEIEQLKETIQQLNQRLQQISQQTPVATVATKAPETQLTQWVNTRFGENPSQLDGLTPQDFIQGLMALSQDTQAMVQGLTQAVPQQVQGIINQQTQQYQQVQSKEQALNSAIGLFLQNKAQASGISIDQIRPQYDYVVRSLKNSGTYLLSDNPAQVSQFALDELTAYDNQLSWVSESSEVAAAAAAGRRGEQQRRDANQEMAQLRANPRRPLATQPNSNITLPTVKGLVDAEQVYQELRRPTPNTQRY